MILRPVEVGQLSWTSKWQNSGGPTSLGAAGWATVIGVLAVFYATLLGDSVIKRFIGQLPLESISRVFGMILIVISVQFIVEGLQTVFPEWTMR